MSDVQFRSLSAAWFMRKGLPSFKFLLQAVFIEPLKSLNIVIDVVSRLFLNKFLRRLLFFLRFTARVRQVVETFRLVSLETLQLQLSTNNLFEVLFIAVVFIAFFLIEVKVHYSFLRLSSSIFFWHILIFR